MTNNLHTARTEMLIHGICAVLLVVIADDEFYANVSSVSGTGDSKQKTNKNKLSALAKSMTKLYFPENCQHKSTGIYIFYISSWLKRSQPADNSHTNNNFPKVSFPSVRAVAAVAKTS